MKKTIGIFAHVDAGKTTFSEQILYHTESIRKRGRVDNKEAFLDDNEIERRRGITIFSGVGNFNYNNDEYFLLDTPGHIDFSPEMERTISILDYAIIIISAVEGIQAHTETIWRLLSRHNIPTFIFINKVDRTGADVEAVAEDIKKKFSYDLCVLSSQETLDNFSQDTVETIAEKDDELLEHYLNGEYHEDLWRDTLKSLISHRKIFVVASGSALQDQGIEQFLNVFTQLTYVEYDHGIHEDFKARVLKIKYDDKGNRVTFIKVLSGSVAVKQDVQYNIGEEGLCEKINEIRKYNGNGYVRMNIAEAGDVCGIVGISSLKAGMGINMENEEYKDMVPTLKARVIFDEKLNPKEVLQYFKMLEAEEDSLNVTWSEELQQLSISIMGKVQLEVLKEVLNNRFNIMVEFGTPEILYKETIHGITYGYGHFEPLRHYAEVNLKIEGSTRGSGIIFENKCTNEMLPPGYQNLVRTHIFEKEHRGILTGSGLTDLKITLINGRAHLKHTCGGDFRQATKRALRQGLECANNVLLEPFYKFSMEVSVELMGRIISDVQRLYGTFEEPIINGDRVIIQGIGPVSTFMDYALEFQDFTRGKGNLSFMFHGYDLCHNSEEVIDKISYDKDADAEYTSSSVFCAKGAGYSVPWHEAKEHMHCLK